MLKWRSKPSMMNVNDYPSHQPCENVSSHSIDELIWQTSPGAYSFDEFERVCTAQPRLELMSREMQLDYQGEPDMNWLPLSRSGGGTKRKSSSSHSISLPSSPEEKKKKQKHGNDSSKKNIFTKFKKMLSRHTSRERGSRSLPNSPKPSRKADKELQERQQSKDKGHTRLERLIQAKRGQRSTNLSKRTNSFPFPDSSPRVREDSLKSSISHDEGDPMSSIRSTRCALQVDEFSNIFANQRDFHISTKQKNEKSLEGSSKSLSRVKGEKSKLSKMNKSFRENPVIEIQDGTDAVRHKRYSDTFVEVYKDGEEFASPKSQFSNHRTLLATSEYPDEGGFPNREMCSGMVKQKRRPFIDPIAIRNVKTSLRPKEKQRDPQPQLGKPTTDAVDQVPSGGQAMTATNNNNGFHHHSEKTMEEFTIGMIRCNLRKTPSPRVKSNPGDCPQVVHNNTDNDRTSISSYEEEGSPNKHTKVKKMIQTFEERLSQESHTPPCLSNSPKNINSPQKDTAEIERKFQKFSAAGNSDDLFEDKVETYQSHYTLLQSCSKQLDAIIEVKDGNSAPIGGDTKTEPFWPSAVYAVDDTDSFLQEDTESRSYGNKDCSNNLVSKTTNKTFEFEITHQSSISSTLSSAEMVEQHRADDCEKVMSLSSLSKLALEATKFCSPSESFTSHFEMVLGNNGKVSLSVAGDHDDTSLQSCIDAAGSHCSDQTWPMEDSVVIDSDRDPKSPNVGSTGKQGETLMSGEDFAQYQNEKSLERDDDTTYCHETMSVAARSTVPCAPILQENVSIGELKEELIADTKLDESILGAGCELELAEGQDNAVTRQLSITTRGSSDRHVLSYEKDTYLKTMLDSTEVLKKTEKVSDASRTELNNEDERLISPVSQKHVKTPIELREKREAQCGQGQSKQQASMNDLIGLGAEGITFTMPDVALQDHSEEFQCNQTSLIEPGGTTINHKKVSFDLSLLSPSQSRTSKESDDIANMNSLLSDQSNIYSESDIISELEDISPDSINDQPDTFVIQKSPFGENSGSDTVDTGSDSSSWSQDIDSHSHSSGEEQRTYINSSPSWEVEELALKSNIETRHQTYVEIHRREDSSRRASPVRIEGMGESRKDLAVAGNRDDEPSGDTTCPRLEVSIVDSVNAVNATELLPDRRDATDTLEDDETFLLESDNTLSLARNMNREQKSEHDIVSNGTSLSEEQNSFPVRNCEEKRMSKEDDESRTRTQTTNKPSSQIIQNENNPEPCGETLYEKGDTISMNEESSSWSSNPSQDNPNEVPGYGSYLELLQIQKRNIRSKHIVSNPTLNSMDANFSPFYQSNSRLEESKSVIGQCSPLYESESNSLLERNESIHDKFSQSKRHVERKESLRDPLPFPDRCVQPGVPTLSDKKKEDLWHALRVAGLSDKDVSLLLSSITIDRCGDCDDSIEEIKDIVSDELAHFVVPSRPTCYVAVRTEQRLSGAKRSRKGSSSGNYQRQNTKHPVTGHGRDRRRRGEDDDKPVPRVNLRRTARVRRSYSDVSTTERVGSWREQNQKTSRKGTTSSRTTRKRVEEQRIDKSKQSTKSKRPARATTTTTTTTTSFWESVRNYRPGTYLLLSIFLLFQLLLHCYYTKPV